MKVGDLVRHAWTGKVGLVVSITDPGTRLSWIHLQDGSAYRQFRMKVINESR